VKAGVVSAAITKAGMHETLVHTGQHYDDAMSEIFFRELGLPATAHNLGVGSGTHAYQTAEIMKRLEPLLTGDKPDLVLIYGDTNSTLAAALVAAKLGVPIAHVEAGLRSFNRAMPEEINRIIADCLSSLLFCPTTTAIHNLATEGITQGVYPTGDVMYDVALRYGPISQASSTVLKRLHLTPHSYYLATVHRAENTDSKERLGAILTALNALARETPVVFPLHPRTAIMAKAHGLEPLLASLCVIPPVGFLDMMALEKSARVIFTDSGGVQKEAYFHRVPCITLRGETEWVETVEAGWNVLAGAESADAVVDAVRRSAAGSEIREYGDGHAAEAIAQCLQDFAGNAAGGRTACG
jgi:UDP-N-acetylglucosamine 2-epimerase